MKFLRLVGDMLILSFLWFIGSLPLITIGPSTVALMSVSEKIVKKEKVKIGRTFFNFYKRQFKKSLGISILLLSIWSATLFYFQNNLSNLVNEFSFIAILMILIFFEVVMVSLYMCGMNAKYELKALGIFKNTLIFIHAYFKESVQAFGLIVVALVMVTAVFPLIIILPALIGIIASGFLKISIDKYRERLKILEEIAEEKEALKMTTNE